MTVPTPSHRPARDPYTPAPGTPAGEHPLGEPVPPEPPATAPEDVGDVSLGDLIGNVTRDLSTLLRQELALAQAELKQEATKTAKGGGAMAGGAPAAVLVALFLSRAVSAAPFTAV